MDQSPPLSDDLIGPLLHLLEVLREVCGGDLELNIILLTIAVRSIGHPELAALSHAERLTRQEPFPTLGVNARSIAESSGIPRETVRRKVAELVRAGWIVQEGRTLRYTSKAYRATAPAREALEQIALQFHDIVQARLAAAR